MLNILLRIRETQNNEMQFFTLQSAKDQKMSWPECQNRHLYTSRWHFMKKEICKNFDGHVFQHSHVFQGHILKIWSCLCFDISEERHYHKTDYKSKGRNNMCAHQWRTGYINTVEYHGNKKNEVELSLLYLISKIIQNVSWDENCRTEKSTVICPLCGKPQTVAYIIPACVRILNSVRSGEGYQGV